MRGQLKLSSVIGGEYIFPLQGFCLPTQTSKPVQHQSRWERHYPLQECVPADHHVLSSGEEQVEFTNVSTIRQSEQRVKVKNVLSTKLKMVTTF